MCRKRAGTGGEKTIAAIMADSKFLYHPTLDIARSITEIHPYLEYLAAVCCKASSAVPFSLNSIT